MDFSFNSLCLLLKEGPQHFPRVCNNGENVSCFEDRSEDQSAARAHWSDQDQLLFQRNSTIQTAVSVAVLDVHDVTQCRFLQGTLRSKHSRT